MLTLLQRTGTAVGTLTSDLRSRSGGDVSDRERLIAGVEWLKAAQDAAVGGGVAAGYHLLRGWQVPYPETTGYIIESMLDCSVRLDDPTLKDRALRMGEWLLTVQREDGSIPAMDLSTPLVFDTGQVLFGFCRLTADTGEARWREAAVRAGEWLVADQEADGSWVSHAYGNIPHTYYSRVAWGLAQLGELTGDVRYSQAARRNVEWVISRQASNGWFDRAGFFEASHANPVMHTIAYTIRGILEVGAMLEEEGFLEAARRAADALSSQVPADGRLGGAYDANWEGDSTFSCLTGNAQLAAIFFRLDKVSGERNYADSGNALLGFLRARQRVTGGPRFTRGALSGSHPIPGRYIRYCFPNWAVKFLIEALLLSESADDDGAT